MYISVDLAHHEIFHAKVGKGGIRIKIGGRLKSVWTKYIKNKFWKLLVCWETH